MKYQYILFDFDGTLVDSAQCAVKATQLAFTELNLTIPTANDIIGYMGIPIEIFFKKFVNLNDTDFNSLLATFRKHYKLIAEQEITLFAGIDLVLKQLSKQSLSIVTSKKTQSAIDSAQRLNIAQYFKQIIGSDSFHKYKPDPELIFYSLAQLDAIEVLDKAIMVGDASFDIDMGNAAGIATCAVTWGAHKTEQLTLSQPTYMANTRQQLLEILTQSN